MGTRTLAKSMTAVWLMAGAVALLAACNRTPSPEEQVALHRPAVEAVYAKLRALEPVVQSTPPITEDRIDLGGAKIVLDGDGFTNAIYIPATALGTPEFASSDGMGSTHAITAQYCGEAIRTGGKDGGLGIGLFLEECGRATYAFVQRTHGEQMAEIVGTDSFNPGFYDGDVLLFRLEDGALLGGFRVQAESSDEVSVTVDSAGNPIDPIERLNSDLSSQVYVTIGEKLKSLVPGSIEEG